MARVVFAGAMFAFLVWYAVWRIYRHCALCGRAMGRWGLVCNECAASDLPQ